MRETLLITLGFIAIFCAIGVLINLMLTIRRDRNKINNNESFDEEIESIIQAKNVKSSVSDHSLSDIMDTSISGLSAVSVGATSFERIALDTSNNSSFISYEHSLRDL